MNYSEWYQISQQAGIADIQSANELVESAGLTRWKISTEDRLYWAKTCLSHQQKMIASEVENLRYLEQSGVSTQRIVAWGSTTKTAWMICEWQSFSSELNEQALALALFKLHQSRSSDNFGWHTDHYLNGIIQHNYRLPDWLSFFRSQRLIPQLVRAKDQGLAITMINRTQSLIATRYEVDFGLNQPQARLLHGNLAHATPQTTSAGDIFFHNPACYFGDVALDLAAFSLTQFNTRTIAQYYLELAEQEGFNEAQQNWYVLYHALVAFNQHLPNSISSIETCLTQLEG